jgi:hypothetical protein
MVTPKGSISTEGETLQFSVLPYRCSICPPLVTQQMAQLTFGKFQDTERFLISCPRHVSSRLSPGSETWKYATAPSPPPPKKKHHTRTHKHKKTQKTNKQKTKQTKKLGEILNLLICSFLLCLSCLLCIRVRKFQRDL